MVTLVKRQQRQIVYNFAYGKFRKLSLAVASSSWDEMCCIGAMTAIAPQRRLTVNDEKLLGGGNAAEFSYRNATTQ